MNPAARRRALPCLAGCLAASLLAACSTPSKPTSSELAALGVREGVVYWEAEQKLAQAGYHCFVSGDRRDDFDCTKEAGFFPSCTLRVHFKADQQNRVDNLRIADPACIGTP